MKKLQAIRIIVDTAMTVLLTVLMLYALTGQAAHEWCGAAMAVLFIIHNTLNYKWYKVLFKGRYNPAKIVKTVINPAMLIAMCGLIISGIMMSEFVFSLLPIQTGESFARKIHMLCSYWSFVLMSLHIGMHWSTVVLKTGKRFRKPSRARTIFTKTSVAAISAYGVFAFIQNRIYQYLFMQNEFLFF